MSIEIAGLSNKYAVKVIKDKDIPDVYELCKENPAYYMHMKSAATIEGIKQDLKALPPNKGYDDKLYMGFYKEDKLIAVMDLIIEYPNEETSFIGFFMMNKNYQGKGIGTKIVCDALKFLKMQGFRYVRLGYVKGNLESEKFWLKNGFLPTETETKTENYVVVVLQRDLGDVN